MGKARACVNVTGPESFARYRRFNAALVLEGDEFPTWHFRVRT